ncbi:ABC transporter substrate-binding protein [Variovorax sp. PBL-E5]|uniref:ABC transporter substrate-binding protein n=1 Tax=Variovorax sp. PBL-E5 TaxID=434014 RepID=UPI00131667BC|nr:ABC transporter substrate-binding protein [Variovorax sp. PBL-E5]VTU45225.1 Leucine-, isoleucine-, valine-, threonine-, and alanine-binding protein precursor [Variovorax sp. PBL-E5]
MKRLWHSLTALRAVFATAALAAAGLAHAQISDDVVRIGLMADLSGPYSGNGGPGSVVAARMAIEDFGGKVNGKPIELVTVDDQNKPDVGLNAARKWLDTDKVDAIVGGSASSIALGVQTLMKDKQKPYLIAGTVTSDLTGKACSPMGFQFLVDTYSLPKAGVKTLLDKGVKTFFFVTVDYAFGAALQAEATRFIEQGGGKVVGSVKHPLGTTDFSSYLLQAQSSGAKAIVILNAGLDLSNSLKQAAEFRITKGGQIVSVFGMTINSVSAMGLDTAQGLHITVPFYWDRDEASRAWSKRFMERNNGVVPTYIMAGVYSAVTHYLKSVQATGTDAGPAVVANMKATPVNDFMSKDVKIREDGQVMRPVYPVEVKTPAQSKGKNDFYTVGAAIPPEHVFRPLSEGGCDFVKK